MKRTVEYQNQVEVPANCRDCGDTVTALHGLFEVDENTNTFTAVSTWDYADGRHCGSCGRKSVDAVALK